MIRNLAFATVTALALLSGSAVAQSAGGYVVGRVDQSEVADRLAITEVINAYGYFYDTKQWDKFGQLFTEDATFNMAPDLNLIKLPLKGRAEVQKLMEGARAANDPADEFPHHVSSNVVFRHLGKDRAATSSFVSVTFNKKGAASSDVRYVGVYVDEFRKDGGRWRIASRNLYLGLEMPPPHP
jgi:ketosteroid isomerase-like protein